MKRLLLFILISCFVFNTEAQIKSFRFAFISDTHIGSPNGSAEEDLRRTVRDINQMNDIAFVVITGDITELGTYEELRVAKQILDSLDVPYYIIPGNHDTGWSESGGFGFQQTFGNDKFQFDYNGVRFLGCASGPYVRMSDGHVPRDAVIWLENVLNKTPSGQPVIFLNHYPLDNGLDNWYDITNRLKKHNTILALCGHGHSNRKMNFEDIPAIMGRSNLRAKAAIGGYNLVDITNDSAIFHERHPEKETLPAWARVKTGDRKYDEEKMFPRPDYSVNDDYRFVKPKWTFRSESNVISTPAVVNDLVIFGNQQGRVEALSLTDGKKQWSFKTGASIFSSPAVSDDKVVLGSADGHIYCLRAKNGKQLWKFKTGAAVLGAPLIDSNIVYIGGSDHRIRALDLVSGKEIWSFNGLSGPVVSRPLLYQGKVIVGAWDTYLYALNKQTGQLEWKWNNGSSIRNYSPASCIPVAADGLVYVVAPDRFITAIDASTGATAWRSNASTVRESLGISADGKLVYGKTMNDTLVAFRTGRELQPAAWKMNCGYGYDHVPSMPVEQDGMVFFGTRSGVVYCIDPLQQKIAWRYKLDNSMVNTVRVLSRQQVVVSTMDGKVSLLEVSSPPSAANQP
ncbi:MAG TPA: PQQ-binding-like beta-propeller repeat protein [Chitinophagaceae bacterium]